MATSKQVNYIASLMVEAGHAHPVYRSMRASAKSVPHSPSQRERAGTVEAWAKRLTVRQASTVIDYLR